MIKLQQKSKLSLILSLVMILSLVILPTNTFASTTSYKDIYISEDNYSENMTNVVLPYLSSMKTSGYFTGENNADIYYEAFIVDNPRGNIVMCHGLGEYVERLYELAYYFVNEGYSVFLPEHRGHGRSTNLGVADSTQVNVENYQYYVDDLKTFVDTIVTPNSNNEKLFLFAHSMGGGIGAKYIEDYPSDFSAVVLNAPMLDMYTGSFTKSQSRAIANLMVNIGQGGRYVLGKTPYDSTYDFEGSSTGSLSRYEFFYNYEINTPVVQKGGVSYNWLLQAIRLTDYDVNNAAKATAPILLFQAENDNLVKPDGQNTFASIAPNCELIKVEGAEHSIFRETDDILIPYLEKIFTFYESYL